MLHNHLERLGLSRIKTGVPYNYTHDALLKSQKKLPHVVKRIPKGVANGLDFLMYQIFIVLKMD